MIPEKNGWKLLKSESGPDLVLFKVRYDYQQNLRNDSVIKAVVLESMDSANVVAITAENRILMVRQYRFGTQNVTYELPGGLLEPEEESHVAVQRELQEETGYTGKDWTYLGAIDANSVFMDSQIHHWLLKNATRTDVQVLDDGENLEVFEFSIEKIKEMVQTGKISHPHTLSALARVIQLWPPMI